MNDQISTSYQILTPTSEVLFLNAFYPVDSFLEEAQIQNQELKRKRETPEPPVFFEYSAQTPLYSPLIFSRKRISQEIPMPIIPKEIFKILSPCLNQALNTPPFLTLSTKIEANSLSMQDLSLCQNCSLIRKNCSTPLSSILPFNKWNKKKIYHAAEKLVKLNIPLILEEVIAIYRLLKENQESLCGNQEIHYPAIYKVQRIALSDRHQDFTNLFWLIITDQTCASLVFPKDHDSLIFGSYKNILQAFALGQPKKYKFIREKSFVDDEEVCEISKNAAREEKYFKFFQGTPHIAEVYNIFYSKVPYKNSFRITQNIEMKHYPNDLLDLIYKNELEKKHTECDSIKLSICRKITQALIQLHEKGIVHRDIKPENILIDEEYSPFLTDFGLSESINENHHRRSFGTFSYAAPEIILSQQDKSGPPQDIWAAGCIFYTLWFPGSPLPWYSETEKKDENIEKILSLIEMFYNLKRPDEPPMIRLIHDMLCPDPELRLTGTEVLKILNEIEVVSV